ncbi:unnamed protein product [Macrosiphum euphorbiae]|uniref:Uncharacterized protein n=1 Tax=Macrosiphum euphorbiae TaxID=13131 RepID=A0AAV0Y3I9_9HEMI|nr:unnamed protein product [Macrosiphum euphorbiae]
MNSRTRKMLNMATEHRVPTKNSADYAYANHKVMVLDQYCLQNLPQNNSIIDQNNILNEVVLQEKQNILLEVEKKKQNDALIPASYSIRNENSIIYHNNSYSSGSGKYENQILPQNNYVVDQNISYEVELENQNILFEVEQENQNDVLLHASYSKRDKNSAIDDDISYISGSDKYENQNLTQNNYELDQNISYEVELENQNILFEVEQEDQNDVLLRASYSKRDKNSAIDDDISYISGSDKYENQNFTQNNYVLDQNISYEVKLENQNILFEVEQENQNDVLLPA